MSQPFLFVGVGGSGGDTLLHLYYELRARLRRVGITEMPAGWQFLHIDSRTSQEHHEDLPIPETSNYTYLGLVQRDVTYRTVMRTLDTNDKIKEAMAGWRPDPAKVKVAIEEGAGQYRAIGRVLAITRLKHIKDELAGVVNRVRHADAAASLEPVTAALNAHAVVTGKDTVPVAVVISSLAGGTGSGMFQDVCDLLRGHNLSWAADSTAILYAPDVFAELSDDVRQGVQANALATVTELLAGYWNSDPALDPVHQQAGVTTGNQLPHSGPARAFLVGSTNQQVNFRTQQEVFAAVGRTVAAWATSPSIQKQFSSYVQSNWQQAATRPDPLGLAGNVVDMPFSALGYASVGLGRGVFREYVGQCLARAMVERIMNGTGGSSVAGGGTDIDAVVRQRRQKFMGLIGLGGPSIEQPIQDVFDELRPPREDALRAQRSEVKAAAGSNPMELSDWLQALGSRIGERREKFVQQQRDALDSRSDTWIGRVQERVLDEVVKSIVADGLPVTVRLLQAAAQFLSEEGIPHLENGAQQDDQAAEGYFVRIEQGLGEEPPKSLFRRKRLFPPDNERVTSGLEWGTEAAFGRAVDSIVRKRAAKLLHDLVRRLFKPLIMELGQGLDALRRDSESTVDGKPSLVEQWPPGPGFRVPKSLEPVRTQFLVDDINDYPQTFLDLVQAAVSASRQGDAVTIAVKKIIAENSDDLPALLEQTTSWVPEVVREWKEDGEQTAGYQIRIAAAQLLQRCENWASKAPGLGPHIAQSLAEALGGDQPNAEERARIDRFGVQFEQALLASAPLVEMDPSYNSMQPGDNVTAHRPLISQIPLRRGTEAYHKAMQLLIRRAGFDEDRASGQFNVAGPGEIEFTTFLGAPCHPVAFHSLTEPIRSDWNHKAGNEGQRAGFTRWRRARPLTRVVPLPESERRKLVRSWFVAYLLDRIEVTDYATRVKLAQPNGTALSFPYPLLGEQVAVGDPFDSLAAVLEAMPLVFIETLAEDSEFIQAYQQLVRLGSATDLAKENQVVKGSIAAKLEKLVLKANERLPLELPLAADRAWELRHDIHWALDDLNHRMGGEVL